MDKFWSFAGLAAILALLLVIKVPERPADNDVTFDSLQAGCRYGQQPGVSVDYQGNGLRITGSYYVKSPRQDLNHSYIRTDERIVLKMGAEKYEGNVTGCSGIVSYDARTGPLEEGNYLLVVKHKGKEVMRQVVGISR